jgi:hypothetical protein
MMIFERLSMEKFGAHLKPLMIKTIIKLPNY